MSSRSLPASPRPARVAARTTHALPWALHPDVRGVWLSAVTRGAAGVFLDYDGTLTPIADRPEQATLGASTRARLGRLASRCPVTIVSGRDISVVRDFVQLDEIGYAGCHGLDIEGRPAAACATRPREPCCRRWTVRRPTCGTDYRASRARSSSASATASPPTTGSSARATLLTWKRSLPP